MRKRLAAGSAPASKVDTGGCSLALPATKKGGRPLLLHHGRILTSRQLLQRRGSPVGVAECCTCCGSRRTASWLWGQGGQETLAQHEPSGDSKQPSSQPRPRPPCGQRHAHVAAGRLRQARWKGQTTRLNQKEQPRSLQLTQCRQTLQQPVMPRTGLAKLETHKGRRSDKDTEHCEPLFSHWPAAGTNPTGGLRAHLAGRGPDKFPTRVLPAALIFSPAPFASCQAVRHVLMEHQDTGTEGPVAAGQSNFGGPCADWSACLPTPLARRSPAAVCLGDGLLGRGPPGYNWPASCTWPRPLVPGGHPLKGFSWRGAEPDVEKKRGHSWGAA